MKRTSLYMEPPGVGDPWRNHYLKELTDFIDREKAVADTERLQYFDPQKDSVETYIRETVPLRKAYREMLGIPYFEKKKEPVEPVEKVLVASDRLADIYRVTIPIVDDLRMYGIWFETTAEKPAPLVIHPHGGNGTPERTSGFFGSENYHEMVRRFLVRGVNLFIPQLLMWIPGQDGAVFKRYNIDMNLKQLGTSLAGLEVYSIQKAIDWLVTLPSVAPERIGMAGLSYGGYYTLLTAAADLRIRAVYISGAYKDSFLHTDVDDATDMCFEGAARKFLDNEFLGLICPRPAFVELATEDYLFSAEDGKKRAEPVYKLYEQLGLSGEFIYRIFEGIHEYPRDDMGLDFVLDRI